MHTWGDDVAITSEQVRAARALLRWEQKDLAAASKLSLPAIKKMETVRGLLAAQARSVDAIVAAFSAAGVIFIEENGEGAGVRLRKDYKHGDVWEAASLGPVRIERFGKDPDGKIRGDFEIKTNRKK